jgi:hypothetical protein
MLFTYLLIVEYLPAGFEVLPAPLALVPDCPRVDDRWRRVRIQAKMVKHS